MAVRRESVRLDVEGNFARGVLEDAAAVEALKRSLKDLSGTSVQTSRATRDLERDIDRTGRTARQSGRDLDTYTGRLGVLAAAVGSVAAAGAPVGAVAIGGLAGIANDAGAATLAVGSLVIAMHGVAPAIQAVNKAALDPTAANLEAAQRAMKQLSPSARSFVKEFQGIEPILRHVQASAASGWFPGLTEAMHNLIPLAPVIGRIFHDIGRAGGDLLAQGAKSLAGPRWRNFFQFVDTEMPKALTALGHVIGSLAHGLAKLWESFSPLNNSFNNWVESAARSFDSWATGLSKTQGFADFIDYLRTNGPKVASAFEAIGNAVVQVIQAAAPLGGPTLDAITAIANAMGAIADSPLGTPILALIQIASVARLASKALSGLGLSFLTMGSQAAKGAATAEAALIEEQAVAGGAAGAGARGRLAAGLRNSAGAAGFLAGQTDFAKQNHLSDTLTYAGLGYQVLGPIGGVGGALVGLGKTYGDSLEGLRGFKSTAGSGDLAAMQQQLAALRAIGTKGGGVFAGDKSVQAAEAQLTASITALKKAQAGATPSSKALAKALEQTGQAAGSSEAILQAYNKALGNNRRNLASAFDAETNWRSALVAAHKQAAANSAGIEGSSAAALANRAALAQLRDAWNNQSAAVQGNLVRQVQARDAFIKTATAMGVPIKQAEKLARQMLGIPTHINPIIDILAHTQGLAETLHKMQLLHDKTVNVWTKMYTIHVPSSGSNAKGSHGFHVDPVTGQAVPNSADGGTIPHDGRPYADRYLYMLAPGEEVISNRHGQADRNRALLKAINANRAADGGTVGRRYSAGGMSGTVRHVIEVKVTGGELDLHSAKQQIHAIAREVSRDEIDQQQAFDDRMGRG